MPNTQYGSTALHTAARNNHAECVALLLKHGADPYNLNVQGESALFVAIDEGAAESEAAISLHLKAIAAKTKATKV